MIFDEIRKPILKELEKVEQEFQLMIKSDVMKRTLENVLEVEDVPATDGTRAQADDIDLALDQQGEAETRDGLIDDDESADVELEFEIEDNVVDASQVAGPAAGSPAAGQDGELVESEWDEALEMVSNRFSEIKAEHGGDAMAVLASAKCSNEENYVIQKFTRAVLGTNNLDHCARL